MNDPIASQAVLADLQFLLVIAGMLGVFAPRLAFMLLAIGGLFFTMTAPNHMYWQFRECNGMTDAIVTLTMFLLPGEPGVSARGDGGYNISLSMHVPPFHVETVWVEKQRMDRAIRQRGWRGDEIDKEAIPRMLREWCDYLPDDMRDLERLLVAASEELEGRGAIPITMSGGGDADE
jgi:hypothetical protein